MTHLDQLVTSNVAFSETVWRHTQQLAHLDYFLANFNRKLAT